MCSWHDGIRGAVFTLSSEEGKEENFSVEVKSLNSRYLEVNTRIRRFSS